tara:strand:- start:302 stop:436 length:135 start_codon:yes stop_codon:yes gene_type:complete
MHHKLTQQEKTDQKTIYTLQLNERIFSILEDMEQRLENLESKTK